MLVRRIRLPALAISNLPTSVDPVKDSFRTRGSSRIVSTTPDEPRAATTLTAPGGTPASARTSATARAESGVSDAGLRMVVQPAARAGPSLRVAIAEGKFQGVTMREIPTGSGTTIIRLSPAGAVRNSPVIRTASSENHRKNSAA